MQRINGKYKDLGYEIENSPILSNYKIYDYGHVTNRKIMIAHGAQNKDFTPQDMQTIIQNILNGTDTCI